MNIIKRLAAKFRGFNEVREEAVKPSLLKLDLQFFAEGDEVEYGNIEGGHVDDVVRGAYNPDEEIQYPTGDNPLWTADPATEQEQFDQFQEEEEEPAFQEPQQPNPQDQYIQQLIQQNQQMQLQMRQMATMQQQQFQQFQQPQRFEQPQYQQPQQPQVPEMSVEERNEKLMEKFYENPSEFFEEMRQQAAEEARKDFQPFIQERRIESEVQNLTQRYGQDFINHTPQMQQLVTELGDAQVESMGLERVYLMARGMAAQTPQYQQPQLSAEQIFQDQSFINEYIAQNPAVQQAVMQQYMAQKQQQQPPRVMGNQFGGQPSFAPESRPKSISEASKLLRKSWGL